MVMASALLASRSEPCWGERKVYKRTSPNPNPNPNILPNPNPSPNSTPPRHDDHGDRRQNHFQTIEPAALPTASTSAAAAAASDDSSSLRKPKILYRKETGRYVAYNTSNCSKEELRELKRKLVSELELVRRVASRIESMRKPPSAEVKKLTAGMMRRCNQILTKLMKHAGAVWFRSPVDVVSLKLYDYHQIIKNPMDLGTVMSRLRKGLYPSPLDFAADVRLTFNNALIYNPPGHNVHTFAGLLLRQFESSFAPAYQRYEKQLAALSRAEAERERVASSSSCSWSRPPEQTNAVAVAIASPEQSEMAAAAAPARTVVGKQPMPKAKAKDQNEKRRRRAMTLAEKERLTSALEELPEEKTEHLLQIIRKRNVEMVQSAGNGGEVELDFELMDNETLWELARFVSSCSKLKRRQQQQQQGGGVSDPSNPPGLAAKKSATADDDEEDVDICDDEDLPPVTNYPSMEIEKDTGGDNHTNTGSSGSGGSSSSSSSSDGSSSSGSDVDEDAQSPAPRN